MNSIEYFINDCINKTSKKDFIEYEKLYELYIKYCIEQNIIVETKTLFTKYFKSIGIEKCKIVKDKKYIFALKGILIKDNIIKTILPKNIPQHSMMADFIDDFTNKPLLKPMTRDEVYMVYIEWCKLKNYIPISRTRFKLSIKI